MRRRRRRSSDLRVYANSGLDQLLRVSAATGFKPFKVKSSTRSKQITTKEEGKRKRNNIMIC
jgi:hypothetical protein